MKPLTRKLLESGLISKHVTRLLEKWGALEAGASALVGTDDVRRASEDVLVRFAEEIEMLVAADREQLRETRLTIYLRNPQIVIWHRVNGVPHPESTPFIVFADEAGYFIFPPSTTYVAQGNEFLVLNSASVYAITDVTPLYQDDQIYAYQVTCA